MSSNRWSLTFRYDDMAAAGKAYEGCRKLLFANVSASVYRIQLNGVPHVVVIGDDALMSAAREAFERSAAQGSEAQLPDGVLDTLFERRDAGALPGVFWERRSR